MIKPIESLSFKNVGLAYEGSPVLQKCNFDFPMGQNCRLIFANDKERFFFFHGVSQLIGFYKGEYLINGQDVLQFSFEEFRCFRVQIGYGFAIRGLINNLTLRQNLELPLNYHQFLPAGEVTEWINHCAEYFEMGADLDRRPSEVPASLQKATLILRAFIHRPRLIFLDNPEVFLSNRHHANLLQLVDDHRAQWGLKHLFFSTADENLSDCLSEKNIILKKRSLFCGKTSVEKGVAA